MRVSTFPIYKRFTPLNKEKSYSDSITAFNFFNIGTAVLPDPETGESIIPMIPKVDSSKHSQVPYMEFLDHKTSKIYPHEGSLDSKEYWKLLDQVFEDYINHPEAKSDGDIDILERKHLEIDKDSIKYIGKEANNLEFSMVRGVFAEDNNEYVNEQKKLREIIAGLTLEKALEIGLDKREFYRLKKKLESGKGIILKKDSRKIIQVWVLHSITTTNYVIISCKIIQLTPLRVIKSTNIWYFILISCLTQIKVSFVAFCINVSHLFFSKASKIAKSVFSVSHRRRQIRE